MDSFEVLTLNCWGVFIPAWTVRKNDRLAAISARLADSTYDIVLLQEIWTEDDFQKLQEDLSYIYRYSTYFHCNAIGSGVCIFSKWPIDNIFFHPYSVNGYPQLVHQADWYCGKGVGLARVTSPNGLRVNLYVTHLIARYELDRQRDRYHGHRTSQLIELIQFIRSTSASSDAVLIAGDFNLEPNTPDIAFFKQYLGVSDAWMDSESQYLDAKCSVQVPKDRLEIEGCTCDRADNPYGNAEWTRYYGNGERLDYIFYRTGGGPLDSHITPAQAELTCESCWLDMRAVPDDADGLHYSDHEGVGAQFTLRRVNLPKLEDGDNRELDLEATRTMETLLYELVEHVDHGLKQCRRERMLHSAFAAAIALLLFLILMYGPYRHWFFVLLALFMTVFLSPVCFALLWGSSVGRTAERRALTNSGIVLQLMLDQIKTALNSLSPAATQANGDCKTPSD